MASDRQTFLTVLYAVRIFSGMFPGASLGSDPFEQAWGTITRVSHNSRDSSATIGLFIRIILFSIPIAI